MVEEEVKPEDEALLSFLDYILLAAIGGVCFWWFYLRDSDSDKIPEVFNFNINFCIISFLCF